MVKWAGLVVINLMGKKMTMLQKKSNRGGKRKGTGLFGRAREIAMQYRVGSTYLEGGFVFIYENEVHGYCKALYPERWLPGVIAVSETGDMYLITHDKDNEKEIIVLFIPSSA